MLISLFAKYLFDESNCAERSDAKILHLILLSVVMLFVVVLSDAMMSVDMLSQILISVTLSSFILLSVVMPQIIGLNTNSSFCFVSWCSLLLY
jgi:hypothetical protein